MLRVHRQFIVLRYSASHADSGKGRRDETLYRVARKSADLLRMSLVTTAAMLAICLLALAETTNTAEAASLPENGKIAFTSNVNISTAEADGSNLRRLTEGTYQDAGPIWSPDGTKIYFTRLRSTGLTDALVMSADGSNPRVLYPADESHDAYLSLTWSPDGAKFAFISNDDVYMRDADGSDQIRLTNTPALAEMSPDFSPDGSQICFYRFNVAGTPSPTSGIYVMDVDGSDPTLLVQFDSQVTSTGCDWSPDGTKIAFPGQPFKVENLDESDILGYGIRKAMTKLKEEVYVVNADGGSLTNLTSNPATDVDPDWSPDGTKITFASDRNGDLDIYTMDADGSDVAQVTNLRGDEQHPDWQPLPGLKPPKDADGSDEAQITKKPAVGDVDRDRPERTVIVKPGDSLWSISEQRLGPEASPQRVYEHTYQMYALNRKLIGSDPDLIFVGQRLSLPPLGEG